MANRTSIFIAFSATIILAASELIADDCPPAYLPTKCFNGLSLGPYLNDPFQEPGQANREPLPPEQIKERVDRIVGYTDWIRTYSALDGQDCIPPYARSPDIPDVQGVQTLIGTWIVDYDNDDDAKQIRRAFEIASYGDEILGPDTVVIGNEEVFSSRKSALEMTDYIRDVVKPIRTELEKESIHLSIAEPSYTLFDEFGTQKYPTLLSEIDGPVLVNIYPFHDGVHIDDAIDAIKDTYYTIKNHNGNENLKIWIGETGWPSEGETIGDAVPSYENASKYLRDCIEWMASEDVPLFYFGAYDEDWKAYDKYGNRKWDPEAEDYVPIFEAHWGVWYNDGTLKIPAMEADFDRDGDVDGNDFLTWQRSELSNPPSQSNLDVWQENFGTESSPIAAASATVPEPRSSMLLLAALACGLWWR